MYICTVHDSLSGSIDTITQIGIGNGSVSRDLYLRNCMWAANQLKYVYLSYASSHFCFRVLYLYSNIGNESVLKKTTEKTSEFEEVSRCRADNIFSFPFTKVQVVIYLYYVNYKAFVLSDTIVHAVISQNCSS